MHWQFFPLVATIGSDPQLSDSLEYKIEQRLARAGTIGLGYVGLPLAATYRRGWVF